MSFKVLLVYPNYRGMNMLPPAIGLLSAVLKARGYEVRLFDTTYYSRIGEEERKDSDGSKAERLMARPYAMPRQISLKTTDVYEDFIRTVDEFSPDLLAVSSTEDMWHLAHGLLKRLGPRKAHLPVIVGGVFPTFAPELVLSHPEVDIVCRGEGEDSLLTLCERLEKGQPFDDIPNLWVKRKEGGFLRNPTRMVDMDKNPLIDMSIFEEARFYRPMGGKVWRMFPVETHRGCPYQCAYCNSPSQYQMYKQEQGLSYVRRKTFENMRRELLHYKNEMKAEFLYFWADTFFVWQDGEFEQFCEIYQDIKLPFWCQTRIETVTAERLRRLKEIGCSRISFGLEHGNEAFRKQWLRRPVTNKLMEEKFVIVRDSGIPFSVNNIMGFPHETRELAMDTVRFNRLVRADDCNAYAFTPFHGTPLRDECEKLGYITPEVVVRSAVADMPVLNMPQFPREDVVGLTKTFNMYVRFPEARWPEIQKAETNTEEGRALYAKLREEFLDTFWRQQDDFEDAADAQALAN